VTEFTVAAGTIPHVFAPPASIIHAGLPIQFADVETLDLDVQGADVRGKRKRIGPVALLLDKSVRTYWAGPSVDRLVKVTVDPKDVGNEGVPFTGQQEVIINAAWNTSGRVFIRQIDPLPITILGVLPVTEVGG